MNKVKSVIFTISIKGWLDVGFSYRTVW